MKNPPERMCVVCRTMRKKQELIRVVRNKDGEISYDETGKMPGRGAYICLSRECFSRLPKTRGFERAFKCALPKEVLDAIDDKTKE